MKKLTSEEVSELGSKRNRTQNKDHYGENRAKKRKFKVCQCKRTINSKTGVFKHHQTLFKSDKYSKTAPKLTAEFVNILMLKFSTTKNRGKYRQK